LIFLFEAAAATLAIFAAFDAIFSQLSLSAKRAPQKPHIPSTMTLKAFSRNTAAPMTIEIGGIRLGNDGRELGYVGL